MTEFERNQNGLSPPKVGAMPSTNGNVPAGATSTGEADTVLPHIPEQLVRQNRRTPPILETRRRGWLLGLPGYVGVPPENVPTIIAVGGGKGGVGKSLLSANLSFRLAKHGFRVLVIDLDIGGANLHTYFGMPNTPCTLSDFLVTGRKSFGDVILGTPILDVHFVAGIREDLFGGDSQADRRILGQLWQAIMRAKTDLGYDFVVLDLGAGTHRHTIDMFCGAHLGVVTVLPEPTSIENAYMFLKTSLWRLIDHVGHRLMVPEMAEQVKASLMAGDGQGFQVRGYADRLRGLSAVYPGFVSHLSAALAGRVVGVVVNQTRSQQDIDIGKSMELIAQRYFGLSSVALGYLNYDESAWKSLRNRRLLAVDFPQSPLTRRVGEVSAKVLGVLGY